MTNVEENISIQPLYQRIIEKSGDSNQESVKLSLFVVSTKNSSIKKLDLHHLTPEQRAKKLEKWSKESRFVAVIEKGDQIYAHVSPTIADRLQPLSLKGRAVTIETLNASEYEELSRIGHEVLELEEIIEAPLKLDVKKEEKTTASPSYRDFFRSRDLVQDRMRDYLRDAMLLQMESIPEKVKLAIIRRMNETQAEIRRQAEEDNKKIETKHETVKKKEIERGIKRTEINLQEVKQKNAKIEIVKARIKKGL